MVILGVTAMPKSGKSLFPEALKQQGWVHISMSGLLEKNFLREDQTTTIDRKTISSRVIKLRQTYGKDVVAAMTLDAIRYLPSDSKVIVDGIRRPEEIDLLRKSGHRVHLTGIITDLDRETDEEIRFERWLQNLDKRKGYDATDRNEFHKSSESEWHNPESEYGSQVGDCLDEVSRLGGKIFENGRDKTKQETIQEIRGFATSLEGQHKQVER